jgi:hypothetical protein
MSIGKVTIYGYCNANGATGYLGELAGTTYGETDYVYPPRDAAENRATHTITLPQPVSGKLTFTPKGEAQSCYKITLHTATTTKIASMPYSNRQITSQAFNLQGERVQHPSKGIYIQNGKKIIIK